MIMSEFDRLIIKQMREKIIIISFCEKIIFVLDTNTKAHYGSFYLFKITFKLKFDLNFI